MLSDHAGEFVVSHPDEGERVVLADRSAIGVKPTMSANRTETCRRSPERSGELVPWASDFSQGLAPAPALDWYRRPVPRRTNAASGNRRSPQTDPLQLMLPTVRPSTSPRPQWLFLSVATQRRHQTAGRDARRCRGREPVSRSLPPKPVA